jgi:lysophospholipase L1-like esterase
LEPGFQGTVTNRVEFDNPVSINRAGLRGPEISPRPPGGLRVLALGDSFTFGVGAEQEETYPARLEAMLKARGVHAQVLNAGAPGFGVPDEVNWFQRYGWPLDPDVILVGVFLGNDLQDAAPSAPRIEAVDGYLMVPGEKKGGLSRWLNYHSHLYMLVKTSSLGGLLRSALGRGEPRDLQELRNEMALYSRKRPSKIGQEGLDATEKAVAGLVASAGRSRPMAMLIPSLIQVDPAEWKATLNRLALDPKEYDPNRPTRLVAEIFRKHRVPVLDLTPAFAAAIRKGEKIYYPVDRHLTPKGYELVAREAAGFLSKARQSPMTDPSL